MSASSGIEARGVTKIFGGGAEAVRAEIVIARLREVGLGEVGGPKDFGRAPPRPPCCQAGQGRSIVAF
jgi:hypothetical protein